MTFRLVASHMQAFAELLGFSCANRRPTEEVTDPLTERFSAVKLVLVVDVACFSNVRRLKDDLVEFGDTVPTVVATWSDTSN